MHNEVMSWLNRVLPAEGDRELWVLELGSRNVNGSPRAFFPKACLAGRYIGVDICPGWKPGDPLPDGVDVVADAATWRDEIEVPFRPVRMTYVRDEIRGAGLRRYDVVICVEVLEHAQTWREICETAALHVKKGGVVAITAAGPARAEHSAVDGLELKRGEYYANVQREHLEAVLVEAGLRAVVVTYDRGEEDVRAVGIGP